MLGSQNGRKRLKPSSKGNSSAKLASSSVDSRVEQKMNASYNKGLLQQLNAVYEGLSVSSTPFNRDPISGSRSDSITSSPRSEKNGNTQSSNSKRDKLMPLEAKKALQYALAAEKAAQQARARVDQLMLAAEKEESQPNEVQKINELKSKPEILRSKSASSSYIQKTEQVKKSAQVKTGAGTGKRKRYTWSDALHRKFMGTIFDIGLRSAKPKLLLELLKPAPDGLTTEHIKSHLQKYRANSKKTRDMFYAQFDVAKEHAEKNHSGKALNPGFHAYPMPVGDHPVIKGKKEKAGGSNLNGQSASHSKPTATEKANTVSEAFKVVSSSKAKNMWVWYEDSKDDKQSRVNKKQKANVTDHRKNWRESKSRLAPDSSLEESSDMSVQTYDIFKQMDAQVQMHQQIQERHMLQHHHDPDAVNSESRNESGEIKGSESGSTGDPWLALRRNSLDILNSEDMSYMAPFLGDSSLDTNSQQVDSLLADFDESNDKEDSVLFKFLED